MGFVSGFVTFLCIWWVVLFCTLPIGVQPHGDDNMGTAGSAPKNPNLKYKFILTTAISAFIWIVIYILIQIEVIDFLEIAEEMHQQDIENAE